MKGLVKAWWRIFSAALLAAGTLAAGSLAGGEAASAAPTRPPAAAAGLGMAALGESVSVVKLVSIALVLAGVIGLNLSGVTP